MPTGIPLSGSILVGTQKPTDARFGPYASTALALSDLTPVYRYKGLTVGIETNGVITEYWFKNGVADSDFVVKSLDPNSDIETSGIDTTTGSPVLTTADRVLYNNNSETVATFATNFDLRKPLEFGGTSASTNAATSRTNLGAAAANHGHDNFEAATQSANGTAGFVPAPLAGDNTKFLKGDGTWSGTSSLADLGGVAKTGDTMTGKLILAESETAAPLNFQTPAGSGPTSPQTGDVWMSDNRIRYRDSTGNKIVAATGLSNSFTEPQVIAVNSTGTAALRINQLGPYYALLVEDEDYPDQTAFVVDANGRVGIGTSPDATAALKVDEGGIKFGDGTVQSFGMPDEQSASPRRIRLTVAGSSHAVFGSAVDLEFVGFYGGRPNYKSASVDVFWDGAWQVTGPNGSPLYYALESPATNGQNPIALPTSGWGDQQTGQTFEGSVGFSPLADHEITDISGLQTALDGKAAAGEFAGGFVEKARILWDGASGHTGLEVSDDMVVLGGTLWDLGQPSPGQTRNEDLALNFRAAIDAASNSHKSTHATGGSDAIAPADIGAQSIFESEGFTLSANVTLTSSRAKTWTVGMFVSSTFDITLPTSGIQVGDILVIKAGTTFNGTAVIKRSATQVTTMGTLLAGRSFRFIATSTADTGWVADGTYTHTHAIADTTGLQTALDGKISKNTADATPVNAIRAVTQQEYTDLAGNRDPNTIYFIKQ